MLKLKFKKTHVNAKIPTQAKPGDAGYDLCCVEPFTIISGQTLIVPTGLVLADVTAQDKYTDHFFQILSRSGLATKGIFVLGGVVDTGYRGEIKVILHYGCLPTQGTVFDGVVVKSHHFEAGDKIAQLVVQCILNDKNVELSETTEVTETDRGTGGFGSTGA